MQAWRSGEYIITCDGCYKPIRATGTPSQDILDRFVAWRTPDGRNGHVCSPECGRRFNDKPPAVDRRQPSESTAA